MVEQPQDAALGEPVVLVPIGVVRAPRDDAIDDYWGGVVSTIELSRAALDDDAVAGLDSFSHLEVVFHFHLVAEGTEERGARRPRGRPDWPMAGILAQRAKRRPNRLGVSRCRLVKVDGLVLTVEGLEAIDVDQPFRRAALDPEHRRPSRLTTWGALPARSVGRSTPRPGLLQILLTARVVIATVRWRRGETTAWPRILTPPTHDPGDKPAGLPA